MRPYGRLRAFWFALAVFAAAPLHAQPVVRPAADQASDISAHVTEASQRFGIPENWIYAVIRAESAGRIGAVSSAGAMGLMQLMPGTWARQRARFSLGNDPFDPRANILAGTSYLREMYDLFGPSGFLAAYNAGPGRYLDWRDKGRPLPLETRAYVAKIAPMLQQRGTDAVGASASALQPVRTARAKDRLFVARSRSAAAQQRVDTVEAAPPPQPAAPRPFGELFAPVWGQRRR
jgi:soluble lytic murein transglycosylase-like protein